MRTRKIGMIALRIAVAFGFIYAGISGFMNPDIWIGYFPEWTRGYIAESLMLQIWAVGQLALGFWILFGRRIAIPSVIAAVALLSIVVFNFNQIDILFRDISIFFAALALAFLSRD